MSQAIVLRFYNTFFKTGYKQTAKHVCKEAFRTEQY